MKVLVAGGAGFIGSHLIDALLERGDEVACIDNFSIGTRNNIAHLNDHVNFAFYEMDLNNRDALTRVFKEYDFEYVYHLAANSDIQASAEDPGIEYLSTYSTTFNILECMRELQVKKLFFASTSAIYGDMMGVKANESTGNLSPISYYGAAKLGAEGLIHAYSYMNDMQALIFRFPNVVGPRLTHGAIFDFIARLRKDSSHLKVLGDGAQTKPYMHVSDLVDGILHFANTDAGVSIYNIGVETQTSVAHIAEIVIDRMGLTGIPVDYTGERGGWRGDVPVFAYDLTKIHNAGWRASMTSDEAVERTVEEELR